MFDFRQLRYFIAVAEELSFSRAAQRLHLSQPPLSQQIQALERDLGVLLFNRDKRNVALTEPGRVFLEQARQILAKSDEARVQVAEAAAGFTGLLRLAYTVSVTFHPSLPHALLRYRDVAPSVRVALSEMYTEPQFAALLTNQIDVGFVRDEPKHESDREALQLEVIDREPLVLALPAGHHLADRQSVSLHEVSREWFVAQPRELAATLYDRLVQLAMTADFHPKIRQHAQQINGLLVLVAAGMGLALVPASMRAVGLAGVCYVQLDDPDATMLLAVATRRDDPSPVLNKFLSTVDESKVSVGL
ncbi:LysR family transcriptional regulator [Dyella sp.]|uniref:LysR family transcriptional regulator n=1 Tax=Dyella sp. TaxID=1869338 RepID=UPI002ED016AD